MSSQSTLHHNIALSLITTMQILLHVLTITLLARAVCAEITFHNDVYLDPNENYHMFWSFTDNVIRIKVRQGDGRVREGAGGGREEGGRGAREERDGCGRGAGGVREGCGRGAGGVREGCGRGAGEVREGSGRGAGGVWEGCESCAGEVRMGCGRGAGLWTLNIIIAFTFNLLYFSTQIKMVNFEKQICRRYLKQMRVQHGF